MVKKLYIFIAALIINTVSTVIAATEPSIAVCHISVVVDSKTEWTEKTGGKQQAEVFNTDGAIETEMSVINPTTNFFEWQNSIIIYDDSDSTLAANSTKIEILEEQTCSENGIERTITACWKI